MDGAARSCKQNIVEGSESLKTSLKSGIKLTNVSKASFEKLIGDLEDFLRQRGLNQWSKYDSKVKIIRAKSAKLVKDLSNLSTIGYLRDFAEQSQKENKLLKEFVLPEDPEKAANLLLTLSHQVSYLLLKQVEVLEKKHEREGGYTEKLYEKRKAFFKILSNLGYLSIL